MANEFIARKGLKVLSSGVNITGSSQFSTDVTSSGNIKAVAFYGDGTNVTGVVSSSYATTSSFALENIRTASAAGTTITFTKGNGSTFPVTLTVGSSATASYVEYDNVANKPTLVSASSQIDVRNTTGIATIATTGSNTFTATQTIQGNIFLDTTFSLVYNNSNINNMLFGLYDGSTIHGAYYQVFGNNYANAAQRGGAEFVYDTRNGGDGNFHVSSYDGSTWTQRFRVDDGGIQVTGSAKATAGFTGSFTGSFTGDGSGLTGIAATLNTSGSTGTGTVDLKTQSLRINGSNGVTTNASGQTITVSIPTGIVSSSGQVDHNATTNYVANEHVNHLSVFINPGNGLSGGGNIAANVAISLDTSSTHFTDGVKTKLNADGVFSSSAQVQYSSISGIPIGIISSSAQVDVRNTTGIATIATTGSNTFTGVQTISNTTNSTNYTDGALVIVGGLGVAKDVNISGSLNITGLLTAASTSIQYVTSSQILVADNKIIVNTDDATRFGGLSVRDSGSSVATASIYWDSLNHHFIYENISGAPYNSAIIIAGPKNTGTLGNEPELVVGRIPVATGADHIDNRTASSSIRVDFPSRLTHVEAGLVVTGSISSSVGFSGDGSNLTGIVTTLQITGSDGSQTTGTVNLKTQGLIVSAGEGIDVSVSGQTITVAGEDASTTNKGIAVFNSSNFTVNSGQVTASAINFNGVNLNLGSSYAYGLQNITPYGATTTDQLNLQGGAIISAVLHTSSSATNIAGPVTNQVVATLATSSYDSVHFDYVVKDGTNYRTGTVMAVWNSTGTVEYTDTSTNDIGNTLDEIFVVDILGANARLKFSSGTGTWTVKTAIRML